MVSGVLPTHLGEASAPGREGEIYHRFASSGDAERIGAFPHSPRGRSGPRPAEPHGPVGSESPERAGAGGRQAGLPAFTVAE